MRGERGRGKLAGRITLVCWFAAMVFVGAGMLARHVVAMPLPATDASAKLATLRTEDERGRWLVVHVLSEECRCSQRIAEHLTHTVRPADVSEVVLWIGAAPPAELVRRFDVRNLEATDLAALGVEAAPMMFVLDPENHQRYTGGYTSRKQGPAVEDRRILDDVRANRSVTSLPMFGCAVSDRLRRDLAALPTP